MKRCLLACAAASFFLSAAGTSSPADATPEVPAPSSPLPPHACSSLDGPFCKQINGRGVPRHLAAGLWTGPRSAATAARPSVSTSYVGSGEGSHGDQVIAGGLSSGRLAAASNAAAAAATASTAAGGDAPQTPADRPDPSKLSAIRRALEEAEMRQRSKAKGGGGAAATAATRKRGGARDVPASSLPNSQPPAPASHPHHPPPSAAAAAPEAMFRFDLGGGLVIDIGLGPGVDPASLQRHELVEILFSALVQEVSARVSTHSGPAGLDAAVRTQLLKAVETLVDSAFGHSSHSSSGIRSSSDEFDEEEGKDDYDAI